VQFGKGVGGNDKQAKSRAKEEKPLTIIDAYLGGLRLLSHTNTVA